jgi:recombinational DNA repair ATPase RecF
MTPQEQQAQLVENLNKLLNEKQQAEWELKQLDAQIAELAATVKQRQAVRRGG